MAYFVYFAACLLRPATKVKRLQSRVICFCTAYMHNTIDWICLLKNYRKAVSQLPDLAFMGSVPRTEDMHKRGIITYLASGKCLAWLQMSNHA